MIARRYLKLTPVSALRFTLLTLLVALPSFAAPLHLDFSHEIDGRRAFRDSLRYSNTQDESFSVTRIAWLATEFSLTTSDGRQVELPESGIAFVPATGTTLTFADLPPEKIQSLSFYLGPNKALNHADPAQFLADHPLNPNLNNLHWDWTGGYIFLALEGHWKKAGDQFPSGYAYHFARDANRTKITLACEVDLRHETRVSIALDPKKVLEQLSFTKDGATTHSQEGDPLAKTMRDNLPRAFRVAGIAKGGLPTPPNPPMPIDLPKSPTPFPITLPRHVPLPALPTDNPLIQERVVLGEKLFRDPKLSRTNTISCSSCHQKEFAFSDARIFSPGVDGKHPDRHAMPLFNLAWKTSFFWDGRAPSLRAQALIPIEDHLEMDETLENVVAKLKNDEAYPPLFAKAFGSGEITPENIGLAIENFLLTKLSFDSKFDQSIKGKATLSEQEARGLELFFTESEPRLGRKGADCFHCHGGAHFTDHSFHNNGLKQSKDLGLGGITKKGSDHFKFSTPSLRNISLTAPYMHDGSMATLEEVIDHYNSGFQRSATLDPNLAKHPQGLGLTEEDKAALVAFLKSLTDPQMKN